MTRALTLAGEMYSGFHCRIDILRGNRVENAAHQIAPELQETFRLIAYHRQIFP
jgi:hypothetical protein